MNLKLALKQAITQLNSDSAALDAQLLLMHVTNLSREQLITSDMVLTPEQLHTFQTLIKRRQAHEPIAYIIGHKEFYSLDLIVTPNTLIPRPETECLVDFVLSTRHQAKQEVLDLGTGSGAIACAIAQERQAWHVLATDRDPQSLEIAKQNAKRLKLDNINFICTDWFTDIHHSFDIILSNPPYIDPDEIDLCSPEIAFEPSHALFSEAAGLGEIRTIVDGAMPYLKQDGLLVIEHGFKQAQDVCLMMQKAGFTRVGSHLDLSGELRFSAGQK